MSILTQGGTSYMHISSSIGIRIDGEQICRDGGQIYSVEILDCGCYGVLCIRGLLMRTTHFGINMAKVVKYGGYFYYWSLAAVAKVHRF